MGGGFWPSELGGWLELLISVIILGGMAGAFIRFIWVKPLNDRITRHKNDNLEKFTEHGKRIGENEINCQAHGEAVVDLRSRMERAQMDRDNIHNNLGRLEGMITRFVEATDKQMSHRREEEKDLAVQLGALSAKVDMLLTVNGVDMKHNQRTHHNQER